MEQRLAFVKENCSYHWEKLKTTIRLTCHISRERFEEDEPSYVIQKRPGADQYLAAILVSNRVPVGQDLLF